MSPPRFAGWTVVAAAFSILFLAYGLQFSYGLFVTPMAAELGVEAHPMQKLLECHVRSHLAELAEVRPEFR